MNIAIASAFRNMEGRLGRYFEHVNALVRLIKDQHKLRVIAAEGDSHDRTRMFLTQMGSAAPVEVVDATHGGPVHGSTENSERLKNLSHVLNRVMESVRDTDDILLYIESDLYWKPVMLQTLIEHAMNRTQNFDVFSPMIFAGDHFYDVWGFRKSDCRFGPFPPYHHELSDDLTEMQSVGSCIATRREVAQRCRVRNNYAFVGWCEDVRNQGYRIAVCPDLKIRHP